MFPDVECSFSSCYTYTCIYCIMFTLVAKRQLMWKWNGLNQITWSLHSSSKSSYIQNNHVQSLEVIHTHIHVKKQGKKQQKHCVV